MCFICTARGGKAVCAHVMTTTRSRHGHRYDVRGSDVRAGGGLMENRGVAGRRVAPARGPPTSRT
jgi:hypothetical protein